VNSYGKQFIDKKLWNSETSSWNTSEQKLKIGIDIDDTLLAVWSVDILEIYNRKFHDIVQMDDIRSFDFNGIQGLRREYRDYSRKNKDELCLHPDSKQVLQNLHKK
jgi:uncharacterized HAD superfamily protein